MKFYFDKNDGTTKRLSDEEVREHLSICQVEEAIETKKSRPAGMRILHDRRRLHSH